MGEVLTLAIAMHLIVLSRPIQFQLRGADILEMLQSPVGMAAIAGTGPIVVGDHHAFIEMSYYGSRQVRDRLVYPLSCELDLLYTSTDTGCLLLTALRRRLPVQVVDYQTLTGRHREWLLAATNMDYLPSHLTRMGYRIEPLLTGAEGSVLFRVKLPQ
jgi:hypothetical protein